jgi:hypothetical protein
MMAKADKSIQIPADVDNEQWLQHVPANAQDPAL